MAVATTQSPFTTQPREVKVAPPQARMGYLEEIGEFAGDSDQTPLDTQAVLEAVEDFYQPKPMPATGTIQFNANNLASAAANKSTEIASGIAKKMVSAGTDLAMSTVSSAAELVFTDILGHIDTQEEIKAKNEAMAKKAEAAVQTRHNNSFFDKIRSTATSVRRTTQVVGGQPMGLAEVQNLLGNNASYEGNVDRTGQVDIASRVAAETKMAENSAMAIRRQKSEAMAATKSTAVKSRGVIDTRAAVKDKVGATAQSAGG